MRRLQDKEAKLEQKEENVAIMCSGYFLFSIVVYVLLFYAIYYYKHNC